jgi:hypothetical protein
LLTADLCAGCHFSPARGRQLGTTQFGGVRLSFSHLRLGPVGARDGDIFLNLLRFNFFDFRVRRRRGDRFFEGLSSLGRFNLLPVVIGYRNRFSLARKLFSSFFFFQFLQRDVLVVQRDADPQVDQETHQYAQQHAATHTALQPDHGPEHEPNKECHHTESKPAVAQQVWVVEVLRRGDDDPCHKPGQDNDCYIDGP